MIQPRIPLDVNNHRYMHEVLLSQLNEIMAQDRQYSGMRILSDGNLFYLVKFELKERNIFSGGEIKTTVSPVIVASTRVKGADVRTTLNWINNNYINI